MSSIPLWSPSDLERLLVENFSAEYVEKEKTQGSGKRGDVGPHRLNNVRIGKYAELAWAEITGGEPDFEIWSPNADASQPDLTDHPDSPIRPPFQGKNLHVKTCHLKFFDTKFNSWTAARWDRIVTAPSPDDLILLSYTDPDSGDVIRLGTVRATDVKDYWRPCFAPALRHKLAIYFQDIERFIDQL